MATEKHSIELVVTLENGQLKVAGKEVEDAIDKIDKKAKSTTSGSGGLASSIAFLTGAFKAFMALAIVDFILNIGKSFLMAADSAQKTKIQFQMFLGTAEKTAEFIKDLHDIAKSSPIEYTAYEEAAKRLFSVGESADQVKTKLTELSIVAIGNQDRFNNLIQIYQRAANIGSVSFRELRPLLSEQIPIVTALAQQYGVTNDEIIRMAREGKITFSQFDAALSRLAKDPTLIAAFEANASTLTTKLKILSEMGKETAKDLGGRMLAGAGDIITAFNMILAGRGGWKQLWEDVADMAGNALSWIADKIMWLNQAMVRFSMAVQDVKLLLKYGWSFDTIIEAQEELNARTATGHKEKQADLEKYIKTFNDQAAAEKDLIEFRSRKKVTVFGDVAPLKIQRTGDTDKQSKLTREQFEAEFAGLGEGALGKITREMEKRQELLTKYYNETDFILPDEYLKIHQQLEDDAFSKRLAAYAGFASQAINVIGNMASSLTKIFQMQDQAASQSLERMKQQGDAWLDYSQQQALAAAGIVKETQSQQYAEELADLQDKYNKELNIVKRADLAKQIQDKSQAQREAAINEEYQKKKEQYDLLMDMRKRQLARQQFERQKAMQIVTATVSMLGGAAQGFGSAMSLPYPANLIVGALTAATVLAFGGAEIGMIAQQQAPALASGGFIGGSPWGTFRVAEGGKSEAVIPFENPEYMGKFVTAFSQAGGAGVTIHVHGSVIDTDGLLKIVETGAQRRTYKLGAKNQYSFRGAY